MGLEVDVDAAAIHEAPAPDRDPGCLESLDRVVGELFFTPPGVLEESETVNRRPRA
jgi:hypothetical protein